MPTTRPAKKIVKLLRNRLSIYNKLGVSSVNITFSLYNTGNKVTSFKVFVNKCMRIEADCSYMIKTLFSLTSRLTNKSAKE